MQISEFIQRHGLLFKARPAEVPVAPEGTNLDVMIVRGRSEMVTQVSVGEGREFNVISFMDTLHRSFRMLEPQSSAKVDERHLPGLTATRDRFRDLLGESAFRSFLDEVRQPAPAQG